MNKLKCLRLLAVMAFSFMLVLSLGQAAYAQSETANLSGVVVDESDAVVPDARVVVIKTTTSVKRQTMTNKEGAFAVPMLSPGTYKVVVERSGFASVEVPGVVLNAQDQRSLRIRLKVGGKSESVTVSASEVLVHTQSATVATTIDRQFVGNLPANGRSFQTLISLTPGVVMVTPGGDDKGQFSVNGQRSNANYFTVDGVSANFGTSLGESFGQTTSGSLPATNVQGGLQNLVTIDAMEEFKIQTSTFAAEFGRSPGGQISLVTRSGGNAYHGSAFDYFRNDVLDARDYFSSGINLATGVVNSEAARKAPLRYNDFGGTFGGPILKDKTFFFFSYEGQRFLLPRPVATINVPTTIDRQNAPTALAKAIVNAYPIPNAGEYQNAYPFAYAQYRASYSDRNSMNSYSIKIDHNFNDKFSIFGRYNDAPSWQNQRGSALSTYDHFVMGTKTLTLGSTQVLGHNIVNEVRLNGSRSTGESTANFDGFGGGVLPDTSLFLPNGYGGNQRRYTFSIATLINFSYGDVALNESRSIDVVDNLSYSRGAHQFKFGVDYRWLSPRQHSDSLVAAMFFMGVNPSLPPGYPPGIPSPFQGNVYDGIANVLNFNRSSQLTLQSPNYSFYAQDTWMVNHRLTLDYGLRWDIDPAPTARGGNYMVTLAQPPDLSSQDQSNLALAPLGTPYYDTPYGKFAPRFGFAYQLRQSSNRELVLRGGGGLFYDLGSTPFSSNTWPWSYSDNMPMTPLPVPASMITMPPVSYVPSPTHRATLVVAGQGFTMPRTYQWNLTLEQALGANNALSVAYVGSAGRNLLRTNSITMQKSNAVPGVYYSANFANVTVVNSDVSSDYHSMQLQFTRRLSHGLQGIANYTWSHSIDTGSSDSSVNMPGYLYPLSSERGNSDFDIRHSFSAALTYDVPAPKWGLLSEAFLRNWSLNGIVSARTGLPYDVRVYENNALGQSQTIRRASSIPGQPIVIPNPKAPGGWSLNNNCLKDANGEYITAPDGNYIPVAFVVPTGTEQGNIGRNSLTGFGAWQMDLGIHRLFKLTEKTRLEFRAEMFNVLNHPNFGNPYNTINYNIGGLGAGATSLDPRFGYSQSSLAYSNGSGFSPVFGTGGHRDIQFALKVSF